MSWLHITAYVTPSTCRHPLGPCCRFFDPHTLLLASKAASLAWQGRPEGLKAGTGRAELQRSAAAVVEGCSDFSQQQGEAGCQ